MAERLGDNTYQLQLLRNMNVSAAFIVADLTPYVVHNFEDLRKNPSQEGEIDAYKTPNHLLATPSYIPKSMLTILSLGNHHFSVSPGFELASHHLTNI